jgi:hypothetical protein
LASHPHPPAPTQAGDVIDVPTIMGTVHDEAVLFIWEAFTAPVGKAKYEVVGEVLIGPSNFPKVSQQYPIPPPGPADYRMQLATIGTDGLFVCATRNASASLVLAQQRGVRKSPVWVYVYDHLMSFAATFWGPAYTFCDEYICHGVRSGGVSRVLCLSPTTPPPPFLTAGRPPAGLPPQLPAVRHQLHGGRGRPQLGMGGVLGEPGCKRHDGDGVVGRRSPRVARVLAARQAVHHVCDSRVLDRHGVQRCKLRLLGRRGRLQHLLMIA